MTTVLILAAIVVVLAVGAGLIVRAQAVAPDPAVDALLMRAMVLTREQDMRWPDRDGEAKRHQVYSRLIKEFPTRPRRAIARAIEDAL